MDRQTNKQTDGLTDGRRVRKLDEYAAMTAKIAHRMVQDSWNMSLFRSVLPHRKTTRLGNVRKRTGRIATLTQTHELACRRMPAAAFA